MSSNEPNKIMPAIPTEVQIMQSNVEEAEETKDEDSQYVHGMRVVYIIAGLSLTVFCMGLVSLPMPRSAIVRSIQQAYAHDC